MYFVKLFFFNTGIGWIRQFLKLKSKEHISLYTNHLYLFSVYLCLQGSVYSKTFFKAFIAWRYTYSTTVQLFCIKTNQYLSLMMAAWFELHQQWCCHNSVYLLYLNTVQKNLCEKQIYLPAIITHAIDSIFLL